MDAGKWGANLWATNITQPLSIDTKGSSKKVKGPQKSGRNSRRSGAVEEFSKFDRCNGKPEHEEENDLSAYRAYRLRMISLLVLPATELYTNFSRIVDRSNKADQRNCLGTSIRSRKGPAASQLDYAWSSFSSLS